MHPRRALFAPRTFVCKKCHATVKTNAMEANAITVVLFVPLFLLLMAGFDRLLTATLGIQAPGSILALLTLPFACLFQLAVYPHVLRTQIE
jgi:hypothetical protein